VKPWPPCGETRTVVGWQVAAGCALAFGERRKAACKGGKKTNFFFFFFFFFFFRTPQNFFFFFFPLQKKKTFGPPRGHLDQRDRAMALDSVQHGRPRQGCADHDQAGTAPTIIGAMRHRDAVPPNRVASIKRELEVHRLRLRQGKSSIERSPKYGRRWWPFIRSGPHRTETAPPQAAHLRMPSTPTRAGGSKKALSPVAAAPCCNWLPVSFDGLDRPD